MIGIAKGGLFPATLLAIMLRKEFYPVRVSRREGDVVVHEKPQWRIDVPDIVEGKTIVVIDDIADSGETLDLVAKRIKEKKAKSVLTAALAAHTWAKPKPDMVAISSDKLLVFPWDQKVLANNSWVPHPELQAASKKQNL
ncbi:MAG: phosphoribosyltransferase [Elusimicrobia bacterium]|nr:phosphoribosyltransferase [Elusimicrobiota bacterium]